MPGTKFSPEGVKAFKDALVLHASAWTEDLPQYTAGLGDEKAYDEMGRELLNRVRDTADVGDKFNHASVEAGTVIIPRFMYAGAAKAALADFTIDQLQKSMYNHASFNTLTAITHEDIHVAKRVEVALGLKPLALVSVNYNLGEFDISEQSGLSIPKYGVHVLDARFDARSQGHITDEQLSATNPSFCEGQITGINAYAYRAMLTICMNDPYLFQGTLSRQQPVA
jgi:hypothetical protein